MAVNTVSEWNKKIHMKDSFRMTFVQLLSTKADSTVIDVDALKLVPGSIEQPKYSQFFYKKQVCNGKKNKCQCNEKY